MQVNNGQFQPINDNNRQCRPITDNTLSKCRNFAVEFEIHHAE